MSNSLLTQAERDQAAALSTLDPAPPPAADNCGVSREFHERLRTAYQELEALCAVYKAASQIDLDTIETQQRELAKWAACEAERWLDPRGGLGPTNEHGLKLRAVAAALAHSSLMMEDKP